MILLPGQSANAMVKRDASNNVLYGTTGTDDAIDKIVYSRGVTTTITNGTPSTTYGGYTVNRDAAVARTFTDRYGHSFTFPAVSNGWELGWNLYWIDEAGGLQNTWSAQSFDIMSDKIRDITLNSDFWMHYVSYTQTASWNYNAGGDTITWSQLFGNGVVVANSMNSSIYPCIVSNSDPADPAIATLDHTINQPSPLTTTSAFSSSSVVNTYGSYGWSSPLNKNLYLQIVLLPSRDGGWGAVLFTNQYYNCNYWPSNYHGDNSFTIANTGVIGNPGWLMRWIYTNTVTGSRYKTRTYSASVTQSRGNLYSASGSTALSTSPQDFTLTQTS